MLVLYPRAVQDAFLTEQAEREYDDFIIECDADSWNLGKNGYDTTPEKLLAWCEYLKAWGFRVVLWRGDPTKGVDAMLTTLVEARVLSFYIHGEEVDSKMTAEAYEASLQEIDRYIAGRLPIGVHFTADGQRHLGYPIGFPRDTFILDWSPYNGRVHLMLQLDSTDDRQPDGLCLAGLQGAGMYYARKRVNAGLGDGAKGGAPDSRVIMFELMATAQLYGKCDENRGKLRTFEILCGTRDNPLCRAVSGFGNGGGYPDGAGI